LLTGRIIEGGTMHKRTMAVVIGLVVPAALLAAAGGRHSTCIPFITTATWPTRRRIEIASQHRRRSERSDHLAAGANMRGSPNGQRW
jgi:hypothetical protein